MTDAELTNRYSYHAPFGDQADRYNRIRAQVLETAKLIRDLCPDSRERATAFTHLDAVMMFANASIARNETMPPAPPPAPPPCPWKVGDRVRHAYQTGLPPGTVMGYTPEGTIVRWDGWAARPSYPAGDLVRGPATAARTGPCGTCGGSGYAVHPDNGRNKDARRCPNGCPVSCSMCNNPDCDNPGGQH